MKSKKFILLFIFGLFLFLLPSFAEGYCNMWCVVDPVTGHIWDCCHQGPHLEPLTNRQPVGTVNPFYCADSPYQEHVEDQCILQDGDYFRACAYGKIPDVSNIPNSNEITCAILHASQSGLFCNPACEQYGVYDKSDKKCVVCGGGNNKIESGVLGTATSIPYNPCNDPYTPASGDTQCESACGANTACDEVSEGGYCTSGKACSNGTCTGSETCNGCTCTVSEGCTIGGTSYENGKCNPSNKCQYCDISKSTTSWSSVPSGKVCYSDSLVDVSDYSGHYCNYDENCERGNCSATEWYTSCNGSGSCRAASDHTASYSYTFYVSNGKVLKSDCSEVQVSSSYYCETPVGTCITTSTCNGSMFYKGCYQGSCSSSSTYGYTDTSDDSECDGKKCGERCNPDCPEKCCNKYCNSAGTCETCSYPDCTCSCGSWSNQSCGYSSCDAYHMGQTRTCTPSGCDTEFRCICSESCCSAWSNQGCEAGGCAAAEMYKTRTCGSDCSYSTSQCVSDPSCGGEVTINPPVVITIANPTVSEDPSHPGKYRAILTGFLDSLGYAPVTCPNCKCIVWLEWGTSGSYGNSNTPVEMTTEDDYFYFTADNLDSGTTFKFEAFAKNGGSW